MWTVAACQFHWKKNAVGEDLDMRQAPSYSCLRELSRVVPCQTNGWFWSISEKLWSVPFNCNAQNRNGLTINKQSNLTLVTSTACYADHKAYEVTLILQHTRRSVPRVWDIAYWARNNRRVTDAHISQIEHLYISEWARAYIAAEKMEHLYIADFAHVYRSWITLVSQ